MSSLLLTTAMIIHVAMMPITQQETVWWRTSGAAVLGEHDPDHCSLFIYNESTGVVFSWFGDQEVVEFENSSWHYPPATLLSVSVRIGDAWLSDNPDHKMPAQADGDMMVVPLKVPVLESLLHSATTVTLTTDDNSQTKFVTTQRKMTDLLAAVDRCRKVTH